MKLRRVGTRVGGSIYMLIITVAVIHLIWRAMVPTCMENQENVSAFSSQGKKSGDLEKSANFTKNTGKVKEIFSNV